MRIRLMDWKSVKIKRNNEPTSNCQSVMVSKGKIKTQEAISWRDKEDRTTALQRAIGLQGAAGLQSPRGPK
jgi:hypothetical protein